MTRGHILLYSDRPGIYGAEQINHSVACAAARAGYQVTFAQAYAEHHLITEREALGVGHKWLADDDIYDLGQVSPSLTDGAEPLRVLADARPDLILFSDSCPFSNLKAKQAAGTLGIPFVSAVHCFNPQWLIDYQPWLTEVRAATADAEEIVAVSAANLDMLRAHFGLSSDAGQVICNGRPSSFFAPQNPIARHQVRSELAIPADSIVCVTVARLEYSKGYQYQLDALVRLKQSDLWPDLHLIWVGEGTMFDRIQQYVRLLGCSEQVHLVGARNDVPDLLDAADIFVLPSQFEGMPLVVLEAMAKGLPVIATAVSGTPEALGGTGCLLADPTEEPVGDQLVESISRLARDPELRRSYAESAACRAQEKFTLQRMEQDYLELFERVLSRSLVGNR